MLRVHAETSLGGVLQLLVDLQYLAGALSPLVAPSHEAVIGPARELILSRALELAGAPSKSSANGRQEKVSNEEDAERLERWLQGVEVCAMPPRTCTWALSWL